MQINLGGRAVDAQPLRPEDHVTLQTWIKENHPHPLTAYRQMIEAEPGLSRDERFHLLDRAYAKGEKWPPSTKTPVGVVLLLSTDEGAAALARAIFTGAGQALNEDESLTLISRMTKAEATSLLQAAFPASLANELPV